MRFHKLIASGLGTGYTPFAPGTVGSFLGILLFYLFNYTLNSFNIEPWLVLSLNLFAIISVLVFGVFSIKKVHKIWLHDAPQIVIDEIVGVWIAVFALPFQWRYYLYALILFRFFDIVKPLFIKRLDRMQGDWSVMLDDMLAGVYANIALQILVHFNIL